MSSSREQSCSVREEPQDRANGDASGGNVKGAGLRPPDLRLNASKTESGLELATTDLLMCGVLGKCGPDDLRPARPVRVRLARRVRLAVRARSQREKAPPLEDLAGTAGMPYGPRPRSLSAITQRPSAPHGKPPEYDLR